MSDQDKQQLETYIKRLFKYNSVASKQSSRSRINNILSRGLHELALRDIILFFGALITAMYMLFNSIAKLFLKHR
ncbi:hypothetical protein DKW60_13365 [Leucothrix pacifica]|uniref:Uncharacterized protein n=1 Tax=Leucothrix pacifica TaxID=1247513 RepID=A0A317CCM9_9GAMM|nr:hypothetical protein DKW60_13365 [Leucothrix pacifica]